MLSIQPIWEQKTNQKHFASLYGILLRATSCITWVSRQIRMHPGKIPVQTQVSREKPSLTLCCVAGLRLIWHYVVEILLKQAKATVLLPFLINPLISSSPFGEPMIPFCCYVSWTVNSFQGPEGSLYETLLFLTRVSMRNVHESIASALHQRPELL